MDYRMLLKKYMSNVIAMERIAYLPCQRDRIFTTEEIEEMVRIKGEILNERNNKDKTEVKNKSSS